MNAVTTDAGGDLLISVPEPLAVYAGQVFALLIYAQRGVEPLHQIGIRVALAAEGRNVTRLRLADVALHRVFRRALIILRRIAAVTVVAGKIARLVYVVVELLNRLGELSFEVRVTVNARILFLCDCRAVEKKDHD